MKTSAKFLRAVIAIIIIVIAGTVIYRDRTPSSTSGSKNTSTVSSSNKILAYLLAEDYVKQSLKAPRTAQFPRSSEYINHIRYLGAGRYEINSWVDSQNSFGALIRTDFTCIMVDEGATWFCEGVTFDE